MNGSVAGYARDPLSYDHGQPPLSRPRIPYRVTSSTTEGDGIVRVNSNHHLHSTSRACMCIRLHKRAIMCAGHVRAIKRGTQGAPRSLELPQRVLDCAVNAQGACPFIQMQPFTCNSGTSGQTVARMFHQRGWACLCMCVPACMHVHVHAWRSPTPAPGSSVSTMDRLHYGSSVSDGLAIQSTGQSFASSQPPSMRL